MPLIRALAEIEVPPESGPFKLAEDRWKKYVHEPEELEIFRGTTLQHTDWLPHNVLISPDRSYLVDWAWPTLGAPWMDPVHLLIRLMASGHSAEDAERLASQAPAFAKAEPAHLAVFARANVRMWNEIEEQSTGHIGSWMRGVVTASRETGPSTGGSRSNRDERRAGAQANVDSPCRSSPAPDHRLVHRPDLQYRPLG